MEPEPTIRIIEFSTGKTLDLAQARSGPYVFCADPAADPDTLFAFPAAADDQVEHWAAERGLGAALARQRAALEALPEDPGAEFDLEAEQAGVDRINQRLSALSEELGMPIGTPGFIEIAHERGVFDSVILYEQRNYGPRSKGLSSSVPDLALLGWANGARSIEVINSTVALFAIKNYGPPPERKRPTCSVFNGRIPEIPGGPARSLLFT